MTAKGILALAGHANGAEVVEVVSRFMKDHCVHHDQVSALITALANSNETVVIQFPLLPMLLIHYS